MSEGTQKTINATLKSVAEEEKGGKDVIVYQVIRDGMQYPDFITAWPDEEGPPERANVRKGTRYAWTVMAKPKGEGKKGEYLDFLSVATPGTQPAGKTAPATSKAPSAPETPRTGGGTGGQFRSVPELNRIDAYRIALEYMRLDPETAKAMTTAALHSMALEIAAVIETGEIGGNDEDDRPPF